MDAWLAELPLPRLMELFAWYAERHRPAPAQAGPAAMSPGRHTTYASHEGDGMNIFRAFQGLASAGIGRMVPKD